MNNEAAKRLWEAIDANWEDSQPPRELFDEAFAAERLITIERMGPKIRRDERRATVERMRPFFERLADYFDTNGDTATGDALRAMWRKAHDAILDEGAA